MQAKKHNLLQKTTSTKVPAKYVTKKKKSQDVAFVKPRAQQKNREKGFSARMTQGKADGVLLIGGGKGEGNRERGKERHGKWEQKKIICRSHLWKGRLPEFARKRTQREKLFLFITDLSLDRLAISPLLKREI